MEKQKLYELRPIPELPLGDYEHREHTPVGNDVTWRSFSVAQMDAHAREAWTAGLDYGMAHAPAADETTLPDLARMLGAASKEGKAVKLSAIAAGTLYNALRAPATFSAARPGRLTYSQGARDYVDGWNACLTEIEQLAPQSAVTPLSQQPDTMGDCAKCKAIGAAYKIGKEFGESEQAESAALHADQQPGDAIPVFLAPQKEGRWIKVADQLPAESARVLSCGPDFEEVGRDYWVASANFDVTTGFFDFGDDEDEEHYQPSHWMPMIEMPATSTAPGEKS